MELKLATRHYLIWSWNILILDLKNKLYRNFKLITTSKKFVHNSHYFSKMRKSELRFFNHLSSCRRVETNVRDKYFQFIIHCFSSGLSVKTKAHISRSCTRLPCASKGNTLHSDLKGMSLIFFLKNRSNDWK